MSTRRALSFRLVAAVLGGLVLLVVAGGVYVYFAYVRYERVAVRHVPPDATGALRLDVERVLLFEPVRHRLLPLVNRVAEPRGLPPRIGRIQNETGLNLGVQLRELLVAVGPGRSDWVLVLGGLFPDSGVAAGVGRVLRAEGKPVEAVQGADAVALPGGIAVGQAVDGTLVVASSAARLRAALKPNDVYRQLGLEPSGAGAFVAGEALERLGADGIAWTSGSLKLAGHLELTARLRVRPGLESQHALALSALDVGSPKVKVVGPGLIDVAMVLTSADLDRLAQTAAERVLRLSP